MAREEERTILMGVT